MVVLKTTEEIQKMKEACQIAGKALALGGSLVEVGIETREIDAAIEKFIKASGAKPSFLGYGGFPASACISINNEIIHGIPSKRKIMAGDIVSLDVGAFYNGFHGDNARTFAAGEVSSEAIALMDTTRESLEKAINVAKPGNRIGDISSAVQTYVEAKGFSVVKRFVGHGVGRNLHEDPEVPNYGRAGHGLRLMPGMVIAIEPMVNIGTDEIKILADNWTTVTADGSLSAHFEHTIAITQNGCVVLTDVK